MAKLLSRKSTETEPLAKALCQRVRELRAKRGWTLEQTSAACGVSKSMLSEIERGSANPTLAVALRIAKAFGVPLGDLVESQPAESRVQVIRAGDQSYHYRSDKQCRIRTLSPLHLEKSVEYYEIILRPGGTLRSLPHFEGARELLTVQKGSIRVTSAGDSEQLSTGDSAHYPADQPHAIENVGREEAILYLVVTYLRN